MGFGKLSQPKPLSQQQVLHIVVHTQTFYSCSFVGQTSGNGQKNNRELLTKMFIMVLISIVLIINNI